VQLARTLGVIDLVAWLKTKLLTVSETCDVWRYQNLVLGAADAYLNVYRVCYMYTTSLSFDRVNCKTITGCIFIPAVRPSPMHL